MFMSQIGVTSKDIQPKNVRTDSNPNNQNKIRRAWVLHTSPEVATKLQKIDQTLRFEIYSVIDTEVSDMWIAIMRKHYEDSIKAGAKVVFDRNSGERLEDDFCVDSDDQLVEAGEIVANALPEFLVTLPESVQKQMNA